MSNPLASIWEENPPLVAVVEELPKHSKAVRANIKKFMETPFPHLEARQIYADYQVKSVELKKRQDYAQKVVAATGDRGGKTPVLPLATMGLKGGPLLCDHCLKPIVLEGGNYNKVNADVAWAKATPMERDGIHPWVSYISGGMLVEIVENGTLRIYHGYSRPGQCDYEAKAERTRADAAFKPDFSKANLIWKYLDQELLKDETDAVKNKLLGEIISVMYSFDPGLGVNHESYNTAFN